MLPVFAHSNARHHLESLREAARRHHLTRPGIAPRTRAALLLQALAHRLEPKLTLPRPAGQPSPGPH